jgi:glyoxylase-like metal-dependent hydrolase (beta-lactamase superfamily II)
VDRRQFLQAAGGCTAHLAFFGAVSGGSARRLFASAHPARVVQEVSWGRIEEVADGIWALISTPLQDRTTLCNGGFIAGRSGVVMVEAFGSPEGAAWMAEQCRALTGRWPDRVVLTHYHGDHTAGLPGLAGGGSRAGAVNATDVTRDLVARTASQGEAEALLASLEDVTLLRPDGATEFDLGDRTVRVVPRRGHTASDVSIEVSDPSVVFCGDLVWNRFFPNYVDAVPSELSTSVRALRREEQSLYVPGHGPLADGNDFAAYLELLDRVEEQARRAHEAGRSAAEAAEGFALPPELEGWFRFSPQYPERAISAWLRELGRGE